ncbi:hypothetical protein T459_12279 [Capsicum annuum]|uniref:Ubiquitin-like protease family profile domain-containing protein n=1 Tax=Capsicum annuum TaxID=4072 RepID=A0A2G2ZPB5_CAPAN|nr:hypothetical protein T459_12279 [Capsicum annuum]
MPFFLTLRSVQIFSDPKVVDGIKIELFGATTITREIILEGGLIVVDDGSGSDAIVRANDASFTVFETTSHYDYDYIGCTDFAISSECSVCKCQDCKAKHDRVINVINTLTASVKEMTSKRGVIPSKRISYPYTPLEIKVAKRRRKDISKASSSIEKRKIAMPLSLSCTVVQCARATGKQHELKKVNVHHLFQQTNRHIFVSIDDTSAENYQTNIYICCNCCLTCCINTLSVTTDESYVATDGSSVRNYHVTVEATAEEHNITVDNPSTASKEEEKVESVSSGERKNYLFEGFNILDEALKKLTQLINGYSEWIADGLLKHHADSIPAGLSWHLVDEVYIPINCGDEFHWVLAVVDLIERRIRVYESMSRRRRSEPSFEIQKLAKILPTYLD